VLGLGDSLGFGEFFTLGFDDGELTIAVYEDVVGRIGIGAPPCPY
jgi:hypothetical protein